MNSFKERYGPAALVTGASSGIGRALAEALASRGLDLVLVARGENALHELRGGLEARHGIKATVIPADLSNSDGVGATVRGIRENGIDLGLAALNAGFGSHGTFETLDAEREAAMVDLNCRGVVQMTHALLPEMKARGRGGIIIVSSVLGALPGPHMATYSATKAFGKAFAEALHGECAPAGVDVLALMPGTTDTAFFDNAEARRAIKMRGAPPSRVAETALKALGKKAYAVDGWGNKLAVFTAKFLPRRLVIRLCRYALRPADQG